MLTVNPVRHPETRTFTAWAGKYLTLEPYYQERLPSNFPRTDGHVETEGTIVELFDEFMQSLDAHLSTTATWPDLDVHFWPQHRLLGRQPEGELLVLRQEQMKDGLDGITRHLRSHGLNIEPMPRLNENVIPYKRELVSDRARAAIHKIYERDFDTWNYDESTISSQQSVDLPWLNDIRGRNRRYGVIHAAALSNRNRADHLADELREARQRERELVESTSWRMTRPLRWAADRARSKG